MCAMATLAITNVQPRSALPLILAAGLAAAAAYLWKKWLGPDRRPYFPWRSTPFKVVPIISDESVRLASKFKPDPADIVICTFPRAGTTWTQQICEQLRTGGDMNFSEICEVQPWIEWAWDVGQDLSAPQRATPRIFKSHQLFSCLHSSCKYITVVRDPEQVIKSWYRFQKAKGHPPFIDCDDVNAYAQTGHFANRIGWGSTIWEFYVQVWQIRHLPQVLILVYEEMSTEVRPHIEKLARFMGIAPDTALIDKVESMTTKEFMREHNSRFDDNFLFRMSLKLGRSKKPMRKKVVKVNSEPSPAASDKTKEWLAQMWSERVTSATGCKTYQDFAAALTSAS